MLAALALALLESAPPCGPALRVDYAESAPHDSVVVENLSPGDWQVSRLIWRLERSAGALIFDTLPGGAGMNAAYGFRALEGTVRVSDQPLVPDGATEMRILFEEVAPAARLRFAIDLDDTVRGIPGTIVDGPEIAGAEIEAEFVDGSGLSLTLTGTFGADAVARLATPCTS